MHPTSSPLHFTVPPHHIRQEWADCQRLHTLVVCNRWSSFHQLCRLLIWKGCTTAHIECPKPWSGSPILFEVSWRIWLPNPPPHWIFHTFPPQSWGGIFRCNPWKSFALKKIDGWPMLIRYIPDICHFFYTSEFWSLEILHSKVRKFATKIASRQNSVNHRIRSKFHINSKITHFV